MKAILLAGGSGTRLAPMTSAVSKQLLPVYDKPMLYYPLSVAMLAGIRDILIISTPRDLPMIEKLLGNGKQLGITLSYKAQPKPAGIAQAFIIGSSFIGKSPVCLILGDNIFYGGGIEQGVRNASKLTDGGLIFAYHVRDPERYGVVEIDEKKQVISIEEKPKKPKSSYAIPGIYFYDNEVVKIAKSLKPSARGELEITDINKAYLDAEKLKVEFFGRGAAWLDTGTPDALLSASQFVQTIEERQGLKIACLEEIALNKKFITRKQFEKLITACGKNSYGQYLQNILKEY